MLSLFRFRRSKGRLDLAVSMCGVRMGERLLIVGPGEPAIGAAVAAKVGLTGQATAVVATASEGARVEAAAASQGVLIDVVVAAPGWWPPGCCDFDVALADGHAILVSDDPTRAALLSAIRGAVRVGGRVTAVVSRRRSLATRLGFEPASSGGSAATALQAALERAGFAPVRFLAEREGLTFVEAFRPRV